MQTLILIAIILVAIFFVVRSFYKTLTGKGCSCSGDKSGCSSCSLSEKKEKK